VTPFNADELRSSTFTWALWKILDGLTDRYFGADAGQAPAGAPGNASLPAGLLHDVKAEHLMDAARELADERSPVVQALAMIASLGETPSSEDKRALEVQLMRLIPEQRIVLAAVVLQMQQQAPGCAR
jgi:hypothetical protein